MVAASQKQGAHFRAFNSYVLSKCLGRRKEKIWSKICRKRERAGKVLIIYSHFQKEKTQNENI